MQGLKVPFWQFSREGLDDRAPLNSTVLKNPSLDVKKNPFEFLAMLGDKVRMSSFF